MGFRESKNRPVATNFQYLKILAPLGLLLVGACLPQTLPDKSKGGIICPDAFPFASAISVQTDAAFLLRVVYG